jgi:hypothetical protein
MRRKTVIVLQVPACFLIGIVASSLAFGQAAPAAPLDQQLKAQYKLVKMGSDSSGPAVVDAGTILAIQKGGILSVPYGEVNVVATKYQDGSIHTPNSLLMKGIGFGKAKFGKDSTTRLMQAGEKVYPSSIDVNPAKDTVALGIIACDSCNNVDPPTFFKADVVFQFAKGSLATTSAKQVEDTIAQVFTIDKSDAKKDQDQGQQGQDQGQGQGQAQDQGQGQAQDQPQQAPAQIQLGQTPDEVQAALGQPDKIVDLGKKQIYVYKDLKVTFLNGKVSDVQ